ncbi:hypothetical protein OG413_03245 [Streptomyces sp. NBC_01433]|uniref:hypothetical protein n=1 Tax=Streptomyces sp. NBC_01433 TaxID=2903864 RepID=UPI0022560253|nr:hypothetical protein [Streptomyces sp. NBC_01433]MCX4674343.1 hypothetical protein [Streptomyces sp. NBC_01433]
MANPPILIHAPTSAGGRLVTVHINGRSETLGIAHSDHDLVTFLEEAGLEDPDRALDTPALVEWRGGEAHRYTN